MGIEIILYDSSPVTQKIFSHVLYHYGPIVHRVSHTEELIKQVRFQSPDIIFIDSSFSEDQNLKAQIQKSADGKLKNIPIILMVHKEAGSLKNTSTLAKDILQKPISAVQLRELINRFVPKTKQNILNKYLSFPSMPSFNEESHSKGQESALGRDSLGQDSLGRDSLSHTHPGIKPVSEEQLSGKKPSTAQKSSPLELSSNNAGEQDDRSVMDTNTGIRPVTDTIIKEETEISHIESSKEPAIKGSSLADTGTGIIPHSSLEGPSDGVIHPSPVLGEKPKAPWSPDQKSAIKEEGGAPLRADIQESIQQEVSQEIHRFLEDRFKEENISTEIQSWIDKNIPVMVQKKLDQVVSQVVPDLAKQVITQELNRLLEEEENE